MPEDAAALLVRTETTPGSKTVWELMNSSFVLFLMSSIVLSGITFGYQSYDASRKASDERRTKAEHLGTEIRYRLDIISSMIQPTFTYTTLFNAHGALLGIIGNKSFNDDLIGEYSPIYIEFENRSLISLLWELQDLRRKVIRNSP